MARRLKWSLIVGLVFSFILEITSAVLTALHPSFWDYPEVPHPIFLLLQFPGWLMTGGPPFRLWVAAVAVAINGIFYGFVIFCPWTLWNLWSTRHAFAADKLPSKQR